MKDTTNISLPWRINPHPWRIARIMIFSLLFVIAGIFLIAAPPLRPSIVRETFQTITGVVGLAFGIIGLVVPFYALIVRRQPVVTIDNEGVICSDSTLIRWQEIKAVEPFNLYGNQNLTISLAESSSHYSNRPHLYISFAFASNSDYAKASQIIRQKINESD